MRSSLTSFATHRTSFWGDVVHEVPERPSAFSSDGIASPRLACGDDSASSRQSRQPSDPNGCGPVVASELDELEAIVDATVDRRTAAFESVVEMTVAVEGQTFDVSTVREGAFSDDTFEGSGTR